MPFRSLTTTVVLTVCLSLVPTVGLTVRCLGDDAAADGSPATRDVLTRGRAAEVLAQTDTLAEDLSRQITTLRNPAEAAAIDDVRDVLSQAPEWRWYSRDHGILLAIPVRERLGLVARYDGEAALADVVRRLINQKGWGNPPVQVVFIEPELPSPVERASLERPGGVAFPCDCP
jgi:hypothetical protein